MLGSSPTPRLPATPRAIAAAAGVYAALAVVATWPLLVHFHDQVPGSELWRSRTIHTESLLNLWNLWWFRHALVDLGQDPFACQYVLYPLGANLWFHTLAPLHGLIGIVLQSFGSLAAAQNAMLFLDLIAAGVCSFALAVRLGLGRGGALLAGALYAFSPAVFAHLFAGHFELIASYWLPAMLLALLSLLDSQAPRARHGILLGLLFVGAAYSSQYYFVYGAELLALAAICEWRRSRAPRCWRRSRSRRWWWRSAWLPCSGASSARTARVRTKAAPPRTPISTGSRAMRSASPFRASRTPSCRGPCTVSTTSSAPRVRCPRRRPPTSAWACSRWQALAWPRAGVRDSPWHSCSRSPSCSPCCPWEAISSCLATRPASRCRACCSRRSQLMRLARAPGRHIVVAMLGFAVLAGAGWERLGRRWLRGPILGLLAFEYAALPLPLLATQVAPVYHRLAETPGDFAVLELPFGVRDGRGALGWPDNRQIFAQTVHGHPIVAAAVSRIPPETWRVIREMPLIGTLLDPGSATPESRSRDRAEARAFFARSKLDAVVVHPTPLGRELQEIVEDALTIRRREKFVDGSQLLWVKGRERPARLAGTAPA